MLLDASLVRSLSVTTKPHHVHNQPTRVSTWVGPYSEIYILHITPKVVLSLCIAILYNQKYKTAYLCQNSVFKTNKSRCSQLNMCCSSTMVSYLMYRNVKHKVNSYSGKASTLSNHYTCPSKLKQTTLTFSWSMWRRSFISLSVRLASMWLSNALPIFLIATSSPVSELTAALQIGNRIGKYKHFYSNPKT